MEYQYWIAEENKYVHVLKYFEDISRGASEVAWRKSVNVQYEFRNNDVISTTYKAQQNRVLILWNTRHLI